jgi:hypothetical protein
MSVRAWLSTGALVLVAACGSTDAFRPDSSALARCSASPNTHTGTVTNSDCRLWC